MKGRKLFFAALCCLSGALCVTSFCTQECDAPSVGVADSLIQKLSNELKKGECSLYDPKLWPKDYADQVLSDNGVKDTFDYVIVGAGAAGSVVASRLTENPAIKVLVIEVGGDPPKESEMSLVWSLFRTKYTWTDYSIPKETSCLAAINESCFWARGKMIGGSGGANFNVFLPGNRENYDGWRKSGNEGWSWREVKKYFAKAVKRRGNETHPMGGLKVSYVKTPAERQPVKDLIYQAAAELGLPIVKKFNSRRTLGVTSNILTTTEKGRRMSTGKTYLAKVAHKRPNLKVIKNAFATKVRLNEDKKAVGIDFTLQGKFHYSVDASKEVILSAGAFSSPNILMHSGIGPSAHLQSLGIPCLKDLKVGENLQDHGFFTLYFKINRNNFTTFNKRLEYQNILDYFLYSEGSLNSLNTLTAYINSDPKSTSRYPDMELVGPVVLPPTNRLIETAFGLKRDIYQIIQSAAGQSNILTIFTSVMKPKTRGNLKLRSSNVLDAPLIELDFGKDPADKETLVRFVRYLQSMQNTKAFKTYEIEMIHPTLPKCAGLADDSDEYWICYAKYFYLAFSHPVGTCKMGPATDPDAVVDAQLRVHGVEGLRVIDASIMPTIPSGNTYGPTVMVAEKGADMVLNDWNKNKVT